MCMSSLYLICVFYTFTAVSYWYELLMKEIIILLLWYLANQNLIIKYISILCTIYS